MEFMSAKDKAEEWGISIRRVQKYCEQGRIAGVQRLGKIWLIPKEALRPTDLRYTNSKPEDNLL
ncbi:MAG: helix-turn-helix domain-containing protein [Lachnospiraceae bacterium]